MKTRPHPEQPMRPLFFLLGLICSLLLAIGTLQYRSYLDPLPKEEPLAVTFTAEPEVIPTYRKEKERPKKKKNERLDPVVSPKPEPEPDPRPDPSPSIDSVIGLNHLDTIGMERHEEIIESLPLALIGQKPIYPGCESIADEDARYECLQTELARFIATTTDYPQYLRSMGVSGRAYVQFTVDEKGHVVDVTAVSGRVDPQLEKAAAEAVRQLPDFTPGKHNGLPARTQFIVPVNFRLR